MQRHILTYNMTVGFHFVKLVIGFKKQLMFGKLLKTVNGLHIVIIMKLLKFIWLKKWQAQLYQYCILFKTNLL